MARLVSAYVRVSSRSQDVATQRAAIVQAASARGETVDVWFAEQRTASTMRRPGLDELRARAREGALSRLYLFRLDRLTRTGIRDTFNVLEELRAGGVEVVTVADGFSLEGPGAEITTAVLAWAAKMERAAIGERIAAARGRVEAEGKRWGRPPRIDAETAGKALVLKSKGKSQRAIAVALKIPRSTLRDLLGGKGAYAGAKNGAEKPGPKKAHPPSGG